MIESLPAPCTSASRIVFLPSHRRTEILQNQNQLFSRWYLEHVDCSYPDVIGEYFAVSNLDEPEKKTTSHSVHDATRRVRTTLCSWQARMAAATREKLRSNRLETEGVSYRFVERKWQSYLHWVFAWIEDNQRDHLHCKTRRDTRNFLRSDKDDSTHLHDEIDIVLRFLWSRVEKSRGWRVDFTLQSSNATRFSCFSLVNS